MRSALIVGNDEYYSKNDKLSICEGDSFKFSQALSSSDFDSNGFVINTKYSVTTTAELTELVEEHFKENCDINLFYFSGHGRINHNNRHVLAACDYDENTRLGMEFNRLLEIVNNSPARNKVVILDCCYSGAIGMDEYILKDRSNLAEGVIILTATRKGDNARGNIQGSFFTRFLIEALDGNASNEKGEITILSIYNYIYRKMQSREINQIPVFKGCISDYVVLKMIPPAVAFNYMSDYIANSIESTLHCLPIVKTVYLRPDYLKLLSLAISEAKDEVLFTSSQILSNDDEYGEIQAEINQRSKEFASRNSKRKHFGIVNSTKDGFEGAIELKKQVESIILKYHPEIERIRYNFLICDVRKVVIRFKQPNKDIYYALIIDNISLAKLMRNYFLKLWDNATSMKEKLESSFSIMPDEKENIIPKLFSHERQLNAFLKKIGKIDDLAFSRRPKKNKSIPNLGIFEVLDNHNSDHIDSYLKHIDYQLSKNNISIEHIGKLSKYIQSKNTIDYSQISQAFTFQFFLANYFKVIHSLYEIDKIINLSSFENLNVLDLGCGSGASTAAFLDYMRSSNIVNKVTSITLVDISKQQLEICNSILNKSGDFISYEHEDALKYLNKTDVKFDLIISSNFLCENTLKSRISLLNGINSKLAPNGYFLVVEQLESNVYEDIIVSEKFNLKKYKFKNERYEIDTVIDEDLDMKIKNSNTELMDFLKKTYTLRYGLYSTKDN